MSTFALTTAHVADLTGLTTRQINHWARTGVFVPSIKQAKGSGTRKLYSFQDAIQLRSLAQLKCFRWSNAKLQQAIALLREVMNDPNPLSQAMLVGSRNTLLAVYKTKEGQKIFLDLARSGRQQVLEVVLETLTAETQHAIERFLDTNLKE